MFDTAKFIILINVFILIVFSKQVFIESYGRHIQNYYTAERRKNLLIIVNYESNKNNVQFCQIVPPHIFI